MWMKRIEAADRKTSPDYETATEWLNKIPPAHWARSHFLISSFYDVIVNNMTESFNSYILEARDMPIISMFEWIRTKLMSRIQVKRKGIENYVSDICPNIVKRLNENEQKGRNCAVVFCGMMEYQIQTPNGQNVVDLAKKECSCGRFQLCGYPCAHACAAIREHRMQISEFVHQYYKKEAYLRTYSYMIHAVPGEDDYCNTEYEPLGPPEVKIRAGRPKKKRKKGIDEVQKTSTRQGLTHTCSNCLKIGHNKASCTNPTHERSRCNQGSSRIQSRGRKKNASKHPRTVFTQGTTSTGSQIGATSTPVSRHQSLSSDPFQSRSNLVSQPPPSSQQEQEQSSSIAQPSNHIIAHASASAKKNENSSATTSARTLGNEREIATVSAMGSANVSAMANASCGENLQNTAAKKLTVSKVLEKIRKRAKERGGHFIFRKD
ncbi:uncharacterized protein [Henckelia pumila]|uniref:uncharacterized protein n=1 Tax=Henckelia pumila TaxID=405737 RepID=UPI003C6DDD15